MPTWLTTLPERFWTSSPVGIRAPECSPLYITRYSGPRKSASFSSYGWWEFTAMIGGSTRLTVNKTAVTQRKNDILLLAPGTRHTEEGEADTIWVGFRGTRVATLAGGLGPFTLVKSKMLTEDFRALFAFAEQAGPGIGPELDAMTLAALARFVRLATQSAQGPAPGWVERAREQIRTRLAERLTIPDLARAASCSEGYFRQIFRRHTGQTPTAYIQQVRMREACHLLAHTPWPIGDVAREVGIEDQHQFSHVFRRIVGQSPSQWRESGRDLNQAALESGN